MHKMLTSSSSSTFLSYEQQKLSFEIFPFSSSHVLDMEFQMDKPWNSKCTSISSTSSISSANSFNGDASDDESIGDEKILNWKKRKILKKLEERDRHFELEHLLKRKSLQLCRQSSYPISEEMQWNTTMSQQPLTASMRIRRDSKSEYLDSIPRSIIQIAKQLRSNCDKILDKSVPFVIDSSLLWTISEAVNQVTTNRVPPQETTQEYEDQVLFLSDFFEQTPSLAIAFSETGPNISSGSLDLTLFRALEFLELRKVPPHFVSGLNTLRTKLQRIKSSRNIESLDQIFNVPFCAEIMSSPGNTLSPITYPVLTSVWPELREIDVSFNRITHVNTTALECTPALEILNLSRNRIISIDSNFSRILHTLTVLNLNYNQLTTVPPTPPNLKVLLLSNNYIPTLLSQHPLPQHLQMLDLSQNVISDEREIESIRTLTYLRTLAFIGNPITYSDKYRKTVASHLSRNVLQSKVFVLDQKKLSTSEVRSALESIKRPTLLINPSPFLLSKSKSSSCAQTTSRDRLGDLRSLTQSFDSTSSSLRSACRKKAKIRELVILDADINPSPLEQRSIGRKSKSRLSSGSSSSSIEEVPFPASEDVIKATGEALQSIRQKYGEEFWLFRQGGQDVSNLLNIDHRPESPSKKGLSFSRSLPLTTKDSSFYSALSEWELNTTVATPLVSSTDLQIKKSEESIKPVDESSSSDGLVFYPCHSESTSASLGSSLDVEFQLDIFQDTTGKAEYFRTFESGRSLQLVILENFLYYIEPEKNNSILCKWDLKSLKLLREDKRTEEIETAQFSLSFDTLRKTLRDKSFIMPFKDFKVFQERANTFLQEKTLKEFGEAFQCTKCQWVFSRGMANTTVVTGGKVPKVVPICLNPSCQSELLIPFETVDTTAQNTWEPRRTSTPITEFFGGKSLPLDTNLLERCRKGSLSCLGSSKSSPPSSNTTNSTTTKDKKEPKSESDIETLSCDSSSIEVLPKTQSSSGNDSGSDVAVVEEGVELDNPEVMLSATKNFGIPMTDSTSSGSCTGSICTQYENTITASNPLAQQLSPFLMKHSVSNGTLLPSLSTPPIKYDYEKFNQVDHRLLLYSELSLFKHQEEKLLALTKVMVMTTSGSFPCVIIFSNKKIYFCKSIGVENDRIETWLQNWKNFPLSKLNKLDVLIGRHGIGLEFLGKYFALIFRDSTRTSNFIEFFLCEVSGEMECPPLVQDFSQTQKALMSPTNPISYFGILRHAYCGSGQGTDRSYAVSAVVVTNEELILVADLSWLVNRVTNEAVSVRHVRELMKLRQVESLEVDVTFVRLVFELETVMLKWELAFETEQEKKIFLVRLKSQAKDVPFISLSQPRLL